MLKTWIFVVSMAVCLVFLPAILFAQSISMPVIKIASTDPSVTVPLVLDGDLSSKEIISYTAEIHWDETILKNPEIQRDGTLTENWAEDGFFQNNSSAGELKFGHFVGDQSLAGSGILAFLKFEVNGSPGDSTELIFDLFTLNSEPVESVNGVIHLNNLPAATTLEIKPVNPRTNDDLLGSYIFQDSDGDSEINSTVLWYKNDVLQPTLNNKLTVNHSLISKGESWHFTAQVSDSLEMGPISTSEKIKILNTPPVADSLKIISANTTSEGTLTAYYSFFDADGDGESDSEIKWFKNGELQADLNGQNQVFADELVRGDQWYFTIIPGDGENVGEMKTSPTVTIQNAPPLVSDLTILPENPLEIDSLEINYLFSDPDGDAEGDSEIRWYRNDENQTALFNQYIVPSNLISSGDEWHAEVKPHDGTEFGVASLSPKVRIRGLELNVDFSADTTTGIDSLQVRFTDLSDGIIEKWEWDFGDGATSTESNPVHTFYAGDEPYPVKLTIEGPGGVKSKIKEDYIAVYRKVRTYMDAQPIFGKPGMSVNLIGGALGHANLYKWYIGDDEPIEIIGETANRSVEFTETGIFDVALMASGNGGKDSTFCSGLIFVDSSAVELQLEKSDASNWQNAIDHNVFDTLQQLSVPVDDAGAVFSIKDGVTRRLTKMRFKKSVYFEQTPSVGIKIFVSDSGMDSTDFKPFLSREIVTDDWDYVEFADSVAARYLKIQLFPADSSEVDSLQFTEIQVCAEELHPTGVSTGEIQQKQKLEKFAIGANYPNPFNPETHFQISLPKEARLHLAVYNIQGQIVRILKNEKVASGLHTFSWNGLSQAGKVMSSGAYFIVMKAVTADNQTFSDSRKILFLK